MIFVNAKALRWLIGTGFLIFVLWLGLVAFSTSQLPVNWNRNFLGNEKMDPQLPISASKDTPKEFWVKVDLTKFSLPDDALSEAKNISVEQIDIKLPQGTVHGLKTSADNKNSKLTVLFLHGARFDAEVWRDLGTLQLLAAAGYTTYAVDLPGYGKTKGTFPESKKEFMTELFSILNLKNVVLISPSMSGSFSLPFLVDHPEYFAGFFPVAPVQTELIPAARYARLTVPTVIFYGLRDERLGVPSLENLKAIPHHRVFPVPDAGHATYLDQPTLFHQVLFNFLQVLDEVSKL